MADLVIPKIERVEDGLNYGHFVAEPLEKGFGITMGNSLRRVLLRYLPGAAVTQVWIDGVSHEFMPIPFIKEDVMEMLLNIKELRIKPLSGQPGKLILNKQGEGEIHASDIEKNVDFEIANPDLYLATIDSPEGKLYAEFTVEIGTGYRMSETRDDMPVGTIPVDSIFSPVRKVNFTTEPVHVGRETSQERLNLEVWTDGTMSPVMAVGMSADILRSQLEPFIQYSEGSAEEQKGALKTAIPSDIYNMPIEQLDLSVRALNCLKRGDINTVGELVSMNEEEVASLRNFGQKSRREVEEKLKSMGLAFASGEGSSEKQEETAGEKEPETEQSQQNPENE